MTPNVPRERTVVYEHATVALSGPSAPACIKCNSRASAVVIEDGVMVDEERWVCASCLLHAVDAYPEAGEGPTERDRYEEALCEIANGEWTGWASGRPRRIAQEALDGA
jgi:hypothetical protein